MPVKYTPYYSYNTCSIEVDKFHGSPGTHSTVRIWFPAAEPWALMAVAEQLDAELADQARGACFFFLFSKF